MSKTENPTRRQLFGGGLALLAGTGVVGALAACAQPGQEAPVADHEVTGRIDFWHWGSQDYFVRYRTLADEFQKRHPKITVEVTLHSSGMGPKLVAAMSSGTAPETYVLDFQNGRASAKQGQVEILQDRARKSRVLKLGEYHKLAIDAMSYQGKLIGLPGVGIPGGSAPNLVFYNADHFRQAGLATPYELWKQDKWTWAAFVQAAERLVKRDPSGKMSTIPTDTGQHRLWMNTAGAKEVDDVSVPTKCLYDQPAAIKALQFLQDLVHKHRVMADDTKAEVGLGSDQAFMEGRLSMKWRWTTGINVYRPITSFKWGMAPYPKDSTYANDYTAAGLSIARGIKQQDAAWAWIEWASSPEGQKIDAASTTGVPFNPEAQKVFRENLKAIAHLETPDTPGELISSAKYSFLRLLAVDEKQIRTDFIDPEMKKLWGNEANALTAGRNIARTVNDFLKANPQT